ncbi:MAG: FAD-binding oxidoreductase [Candidatus Cloacimonadota bacterium]|nr:FAD-binding oxidoreductase [Candidatus Cloacimonadota bacterium]
MKQNYDVVIIGAGSVGVPTALALAKKKVKVLVIDELASAGQGNNKKAIGGIRATHSDYGKIQICLRSVEIFSSWKYKYGDDIGWQQNGYSYPAYTAKDEKMLKDLMRIQKSYGLNIEWLSPQDYAELVPGIKREGLKGSTFSPEDGSASPLLAMNAFYFKSKELGADYHFQEKVTDILTKNNKIRGVKTDYREYSCKFVVNAAGNNANNIGKMIGLDLPVQPDCHEAAITEPVKPFFKPMVVDMRPAEDSANYYFYQNNEGQVVFCITPDPPILGICNESTSHFLPQVTKRMIDLYPRLANLKVRRTWRGQYPMTPDGFPIVGTVKEMENYVNAVGMCGQGYMIGPGLGELICRIITNNKNEDDDKILKSFDINRNFNETEKFK